MDYDYREKKTVVVLKANLELGVAVNVIGHLAVTLSHNAIDHMGRELLKDASGISHLGVSKYPFIVTKAKESKIRAALEIARSDSRILVADFPRQMLDTKDDNELYQSLIETEEANLEYLGAIFFGDTEVLNPITRRFSLYN